MKKIFLFLSLTIVSMFTFMLPSFAKTYYGFGFDIVPKYINNTTKMTVSNVVPGSSVAKNDKFLQKNIEISYEKIIDLKKQVLI